MAQQIQIVGQPTQTRLKSKKIKQGEVLTSIESDFIDALEQAKERVEKAFKGKCSVGVPTSSSQPSSSSLPTT